MALALGAGWLALCSSRSSSASARPPPGVEHYVVVMAVTYALGSLILQRRYR